MNRRGFLVSMMLVVLSWGLNYVVTKAGVSGVSPEAFVFWRFLGTAVVTLPWLLRARPGSGREWMQIAVLGLVGVDLYQWLFTTALKDTLAANVAFLFDLSPLLTLVAERIFRMRQASGAMFVGAGVSLIGVLLLVGASGAGSLIGDLYALGASAAWTGFIVLTGRFRLRIRGVPLTGWMSVVGTVGMAPFAWGSAPWTMGTGTQLALLYTIGFVTVMGLTLWQGAVMAVGGSQASLYLYLIPAVAAVAGWVFLRETMSLVQIAGAALIIVGVMVAEGLAGSVYGRFQPKTAGIAAVRRGFRGGGGAGRRPES